MYAKLQAAIANAPALTSGTGTGTSAASDNETYTYENISEIAKHIQSKINVIPKVGIICGTGLGVLGDSVTDPITIPYTDIPNFPVTTVEGHEGSLVFGVISKTPVMLMKGRFHYYEGYSLSKCVMPVRLMKILGVTHLIVSNAAGGLNPSFKPGDIMLIKDHINIMGMAGISPLVGPNEPEFGTRFPSLYNAYDATILKQVKGMAKKSNLGDTLKVGVYASVGGPNFETIAEMRALRLLGADAVGMSTTHEITAARHCDLTCFAFSVITDKCPLDYNTEVTVSHEGKKFKKLFLQNFRYSYQDILEIANYLKGRISIKPKIGIICGSGLGSIGEVVKNPVIFPYWDIPNFPVSTVEGHAGRLIFGHISNTPVMCMQGRFHYYEGYPLWKCVMPVRLMKLLGVTHLIASNAAGGLNPNLKIGDIMLIRDHFNIMGMAGIGPLVGRNLREFGGRFPSMTNAYDSNIIQKVKTMGQEIGFGDFIKEGVYTCTGGPNYETVADLRALNVLGVDAVGMSTVHEVITARHCNITCFAFSLITNICSIDYNSQSNPCCEEVIEEGRKRENDLKIFIQHIIRILHETA